MKTIKILALVLSALALSACAADKSNEKKDLFPTSLNFVQPQGVR